MVIYLIAKILVIIGALNWGLVGISNLTNVGQLNVVEYIGVDLLGMPAVADSIYIIVSLAAIVMLVFMVKGE